MTDPDDLDLSAEEQQALHELQLGVEHLYRGYGSLLEFHHTIGRGMDHLEDAERLLREAGHEEVADRLRDEALPAGVFEGTSMSRRYASGSPTATLDGATRESSSAPRTARESTSRRCSGFRGSPRPFSSRSAGRLTPTTHERTSSGHTTPGGGCWRRTLTWQSTR